ncbi:uncharacterized protein [Drosophila bipectinata]|uniref:uncharacterized protein n=1 Tax=Drosophila bipectinata TaxID=42026 RepID=UPI0038B38DAA
MRMLLQAEFSRQYVCSADLHEQLRDRKKRKQESFHEYILQMRKIAALGSIDASSVIRYIVDGLNLRSDFKYTLYNCKSFKELQEQYDVFERVNEKSFKPFQLNDAKWTPNQKKQYEFNDRKSYCFNCGSADHLRKDCKAATKCFSCNKEGHMSRDCPRSAAGVQVVRSGRRMKKVIINDVEVECLVDTGADYKKEVSMLIKNYKAVDSVAEVPVKLRIVPDGEIIPFRQSPSRFAIAEQQDVEQQIVEWLSAGIIRPSTSNFASRLVLVNKKDGTHRVCVDFQDVLQKLQKSRYFTVMDLENGFFHVAIEEESKKFTAFITKSGLYECNRTPFGFRNSPAVFIRYVNYVFQELMNKDILDLYMDDIIIHAETAEQYYMKENGIEHVLSTTGVPRGNGQIERVNRTILSIISKISADDPAKWFKAVPEVQRAVNSHVHASTKKSPFELMFGVKMNNNPTHRILQLLDEEMYSNFDEQRQQLRKDAKIEIQRAQDAYKKYYDLRRKPEVNYKVGDLVAIRRTQFIAGKKLAGEYLGPYEISKVNRNGRYEVRKAADVEGPCNTSTCCDHMKLWRYVKDNEDAWSSGTDD